MQKPEDNDGERPEELKVLTVADFCQRMTASQRAGLFGIFIWLGALFAFFAIFGVAISQFEPSKTINVVRGIVAFGILYGGAFSIVIGMCCWQDRIWKRFGLACLRCRQSLAGIDGYLAIATRRCPHCSEIIFDGSETSNSRDRGTAVPLAAPGDYSLSDIEAADKSVRRTFVHSMLFWFIGAIAASGVVSLGLYFVGHEIAEMLGEFSEGIVKSLNVVPAIIIVGLGVIFAGRRAGRLCTLRCHACGTQLHKNLTTRLTGNCLGCGRRVLRDAKAPSNETAIETEGLLDRDSFNTDIRRLRKWRPMCCVYGGLAAVAWLGLIWAVCHRNGISVSGPITNPWVIAAGFFTVVIQIGTVGWTDQRWQHRLRCPHCDQSLLTLTHIVQATGNCCHCGRRLLTVPSQQETKSALA